jgi:hypothetical protein
MAPRREQLTPQRGLPAARSTDVVVASAIPMTFPFIPRPGPPVVAIATHARTSGDLATNRFLQCVFIRFLMKNTDFLVPKLRFGNQGIGAESDGRIR